MCKQRLSQSMSYHATLLLAGSTFQKEMFQSILVCMKQQCLKAKCVFSLFTLWGMKSASGGVVTSVSRHCYIKQTLHISPRWGQGGATFVCFNCTIMIDIQLQVILQAQSNNLTAVHFMAGNEPLKYSTGSAKQIRMKLIKIFCYEQSAYFWREMKTLNIWMREIFDKLGPFSTGSHF